MSDKPKFKVITDPAIADELTKDTADLGQPFTVKPNGHLWADLEQYEAWHELRFPRTSPGQSE